MIALHELLAKYPDEIKAQALMPSVTNIKKRGPFSEVTFTTDQLRPDDLILPSRAKMRGVVVWVPAEIIEKETAK